MINFKKSLLSQLPELTEQLNLTKQPENIDIVRYAAQNYFICFCLAVMPKFVPTKFHQLLADELQLIYENVRDGKDERRMFSMPPQMGKSTMVSELFPAWVLGKEDWPIVVASYGATLAERKSETCRAIVDSDVYKFIFPKVRLSQQSTSKEYWRTTKGGTYRAVGVGGALTGMSAKLLLADDLLKDRADANSEVMREAAWNWWNSVFYTRKQSKSLICLISTRWHLLDIAGHLEDQQALAEEKHGKNGAFDKWEKMVFPAIAEDDEYVHGKLFRKAGEVLAPERFSLDDVMRTKNAYMATPGGISEWACTPAETPILMADWTFKNISEVRVGDKVVGFINGNRKDKTRSKLVESVVKHTFLKSDFVYDVTLENNDIIRCTKDHRWYVGRAPNTKESGRKLYNIARVGHRLMKVVDIDQSIPAEDLLDWSYLAGIIDGEGNIGTSCCTIAQTINKNQDVLNKIIDTLKKLGINYNYYIKSHKNNPKWDNCACIQIRQSRLLYLKLLTHNLIAKKVQIIKQLFNRSGIPIQSKPKVLSINNPNKENVYALETETGNYIAWGYLSSNSLYMQTPIVNENAEFRRGWFKYYTADKLVGKKLYYTTFIDLAISQKKSADHTVVRTVAKEVDGPNWYLMEETAGIMDPLQTIDAIFHHYELYRSKIYIESVAYQAALQYFVIDEMRKRGIFFQIEEIKPGRVTRKEERIRGLIPLYRAGVIWHRKGEDDALETELLQFPKGRRDDRIDALSYGLQAVRHAPRQAEETQDGRLNWKKKKPVENFNSHTPFNKV